MHFIHTFLSLALATIVAAAPPHFPHFPDLTNLADLPKGCPKYCDCSQYTESEDVFECQTNATCEHLCWTERHAEEQ